jgi:hypothetical protein
VASPLENLSGPGKPLRQEPPDEQEYSGLRKLHEADHHGATR